jgi:two-component system LytT family response regulator
MMPITVFVTAFGDYAVRAFEASALDYLLKPFTDERFAYTFARVLKRLKETDERNFGLRVASMLSSVNSQLSYVDRIVIKSSRSVQFVKVRQIDWIEADGVYVNVYSGGIVWLHRAALSELESQLDPRQFIRVHRTALVNIESIVSLSRRSHGEFDLLLRDGSHIKVSRLYRSRLEERLMQTL